MGKRAPITIRETCQAGTIYPVVARRIFFPRVMIIPGEGDAEANGRARTFLPAHRVKSPRGTRGRQLVGDATNHSPTDSLHVDVRSSVPGQNQVHVQVEPSNVTGGGSPESLNSLPHALLLALRSLPLSPSFLLFSLTSPLTNRP